MKIIILKNFLDTYSKRFSKVPEFRDLSEFYNARINNTVSLEDQNVLLNDFKSFSSTLERSIEQKLAQVLIKPPVEITLFYEQWQAMDREELSKLEKQKLQKVTEENDNNVFLKLPWDVKNELVGFLDRRSQLRLFSSCSKMWKFATEKNLIESAPSTIQTYATPQTAVLQKNDQLTYTFCGYKNNNTLVVLAKDKTHSAHLVVLDFFSGKQSIYPLHFPHPNLSDHLSPLYAYENNVFIYHPSHIQEVTLSPTGATVKTYANARKNTCVGMVHDKHGDIYAIFIKKSELHISSAKSDFKDSTPFTGGVVSIENEFIYSAPRFSQNVLTTLSATLSAPPDLSCSDGTNLVYYRTYCRRKHDVYSETKKLGHAFAVEQMEHKDGATKSLYDAVVLPGVANKPNAELKKFIRLDMTHCLYLTTEKEVFLTAEQGKRVARIDMDDVVDLTLSNKNEIALLRKDKVSMVMANELIRQYLPSLNDECNNNNNLSPATRRA